jgi:hypothetical protein
MKISKKEVDKVFKESKNQQQVCVGLYKLVYPDWDKVKSINGFPKVAEDIDRYIFEKFIEFDQENHTGVLPGGLWLNRGFSIDGDLKCGEVVPAPVKYTAEV